MGRRMPQTPPGRKAESGKGKSGKRKAETPAHGETLVPPDFNAKTRTRGAAEGRNGYMHFLLVAGKAETAERCNPMGYQCGVLLCKPRSVHMRSCSHFEKCETS